LNRQETEIRIFASLYEDIAQGFVWLQKPGLPPRCIVKIKNLETGRSVFCEALQFDKNFLDRYNKCPRYTIKNPATSLVMNWWYRARLGDLQTQHEYPLEISAANSWCGKLLACFHHPQILVRVAAWLGIISVVLGAIGVVLGVVSVWPTGGSS
jgi:hypothetical protein